MNPGRLVSCLVSVAALLAGPALRGALPAATLHVHAGPVGPRLADETGTAFTVGHEVRVGLLPAGFDAARFGWDPVEVGRFWQPLGATTTRALLGDAGRYALTLHLTDPALAGRQVQVWVLRASDGQPIRADYANVRSHALATSTRPGWRIPSTTALPPANSTILGLGEVDTVITGVRTTTALQAERPGITYPEWAALALAPDAAGQTALTDFDHDQLANALEFVLGTDPRVAELAPPVYAVVASGGKHYLQMTLRLPRGRLDAPWTAQVSGDLVSWAVTPFVTVTNQHDGTDLVVARDSVAREDSAGRRFIRLLVQL